MLEWVDTYLLEERGRDTRRMTIWWLPNSFFLLGPISRCVSIYLFISSAVVNSFLGREPILPNGQVSIGWVRTLIARLMSWQERWVLSFDKPLIIRLPQERKLMLLVRKDETLRWEYFLMTVRVYIILNDTRLCILFVKIYIYIYVVFDVSLSFCFVITLYQWNDPRRKYYFLL